MMRTIMMDVDGVLVCGRPQDGAHLFTDLEQDLGIRLDLLQREFFVPRWPDIVTGKKPLVPELEAVLRDIAPDVSVEALIDYWFRNDSRIDEAVLAAMIACRGRGDKVFLATNQDHRRASYLMTDMGLVAHVDGIFYSAALGYRKPDDAFFSLATEKASVTASDILFVDDAEANVLAARAFGWNAVHWQAGMDMAATLAAQ